MILLYLVSTVLPWLHQMEMQELWCCTYDWQVVCTTGCISYMDLVGEDHHNLPHTEGNKAK